MKCYSISSRYCFLPKVLGLKPALPLFLGSSGREVSFLLLFWAYLYGSTSGKVHKTHVLTFYFSSVREETVTSLKADPIAGPCSRGAPGAL